MYIIRFSVEQMLAMCGGQFPEANGFNWGSVHHFLLDTEGSGVIEPYTSGGEILPGPSFELKIKPLTEWPRQNLYIVRESHFTCSGEKVAEFQSENDDEAHQKFIVVAQNHTYAAGSRLWLVRLRVPEEAQRIGAAECIGDSKKPTVKRLR